MLERLFHLTANGTSARTEVVAGVTTFLTMAYIIFVQPAVLNAAGMDSGAVLVATCIASGVATLLMADDPTEAIPAFLTIVMMPVTLSITEGIAFGFIAYAILKIGTGRAREPHWLVYLFALLFVVRYAWLTG